MLVFFSSAKKKGKESLVLRVSCSSPFRRSVAAQSACGFFFTFITLPRPFTDSG